MNKVSPGSAHRQCALLLIVAKSQGGEMHINNSALVLTPQSTRAQEPTYIIYKSLYLIIIIFIFFGSVF
jgi:hypothetical protein